MLFECFCNDGNFDAGSQRLKRKNYCDIVEKNLKKIKGLLKKIKNL